MARLVLDANVWISTILKPTGHYARFISEIALVTQVITSEEILAEVRDVCLRPINRQKYQLTEQRVDSALVKIREFASVVSGFPIFDVVKEDPDDDQIIACAIAAKADFIVTYDPHLLKLKEFQGIKIVTPKDFSARSGF